jgi:hypothetical protein
MFFCDRSRSWWPVSAQAHSAVVSAHIMSTILSKISCGSVSDAMLELRSVLFHGSPIVQDDGGGETCKAKLKIDRC